MAITLVETVLNENEPNIEFENLAEESNSPLNQPVLEKEVGHSSGMGILKDEPVEQNEETDLHETDVKTDSSISAKMKKPKIPLDAPLQEIADHSDTDSNQIKNEEDDDEEEEYEMPQAHAEQAADSFLGMADNVLAVGGGFFVKIKKHKEFYDYEEIIHVIDEQNERNVRKIRLEEEDKVLLRPILAQILKKKAKKLTPEQQLIGLALSILMKKAQIVFEIKAENAALTAKILETIKQDKMESEVAEVMEPINDQEMSEMAEEQELDSANLDNAA